MTFSNPITGGQGALVRPAIKSPNYAPGGPGWSINRDGSAEFADLILNFGGTFGRITIQDGEIIVYNLASQPVIIITQDGLNNTPEIRVLNPATGSWVRIYSDSESTPIDWHPPNSLLVPARSFISAHASTFQFEEPVGVERPVLILEGPAEDWAFIRTPVVTMIGNSSDLDLTSYNIEADEINATCPDGVTFFANLVLNQGFVRVIRAAAASGAYAGQVTGDAADRVLIRADGRILWGDGTGPQDTLLERTGPNTLGIGANDVLDNGAGVALSDVTDWATYTPTVAGGGTATFTARTGQWRRTDTKTVEFTCYLDINAAGSGATAVTFTLPTAPNRTMRQAFAGHSESPGGVVSAPVFIGGAGTVVDRILFVSATLTANITGADLTAGRIITITGTYREA